MTAQLQALGRTGPPMRNFAIAQVVKLSMDAMLAPIRGIDIKGVAIGSVVMFFIWCWMNARTLEEEIQERLPWVWLLQGPLLASVAMGGALFGLAAAGALPRAHWATVGMSVGMAPIVYLAILFVSRAITWSEFKEMSGPVGARLERLLQTIWPFS